MPAPFFTHTFLQKYSYNSYPLEHDRSRSATSSCITKTCTRTPHIAFLSFSAVRSTLVINYTLPATDKTRPRRHRSSTVALCQAYLHYADLYHPFQLLIQKFAIPMSRRSKSIPIYFSSVPDTSFTAMCYFCSVCHLRILGPTLHKTSSLSPAPHAHHLTILSTLLFAPHFCAIMHSLIRDDPAQRQTSKATSNQFIQHIRMTLTVSIFPFGAPFTLRIASSPPPFGDCCSLVQKQVSV